MRKVKANIQKFSQIGEIDYQAGKTTKIELERKFFYTSTYLIFDYLLTLVGGNEGPTLSLIHI